MRRGICWIDWWRWGLVEAEVGGGLDSGRCGVLGIWRHENKFMSRRGVFMHPSEWECCELVLEGVVRVRRELVVWSGTGRGCERGRDEHVEGVGRVLRGR